MLQPLVTEELINKLQDLFPAYPSRQMSQREIDHQIGQQEVIAYLQRLLESEKHEPLNLEDL